MRRFSAVIRKMTKPLPIVQTPNDDVAIVCIRCRDLGKGIAPLSMQVQKHRVLLSDIYGSAANCQACAILCSAVEATVGAIVRDEIEATVGVNVESLTWVEIMFKEPPFIHGPLRVDIFLGSGTTRLQLYIPTGEDPWFRFRFFFCPMDETHEI
jgi:hypothetical protein